MQAETVQSKQPKDHPISEAAMPPESENPPIEPDKLPKRIRKPTQRLRDLMEGRAVSSDCPNASKIPTSIQLPSESADKEVVEREKSGA